MERSIPRCIACREIIKEDATICPHCHTEQHPKKINLIPKVLKWVGGTTAVMSLLAGSIQLNSLHKDWLEKKRAVQDYLSAAKFQYETGDPETADGLLQKALVIDPASEDALNLQIDVIMTKLRDYYSYNRRADNVITNKQYKDAAGRKKYDWDNLTTKRDYVKKIFSELKTSERLALGRAKAEGSKREAEIIAHIAWHDAVVERKRDNIFIENLFNKALDIAPENATVKLMYSGWLLEYSDSKENPEANYSRAIDLLSQAKPDDDEKDWFLSLTLKILALADDFPQSDVAMLRIISTLKSEDITKQMAADALKTFTSFNPNYAVVKNGRQKDTLKLLQKKFNDDELIELANRLGNIVFGCDPFDYSCDPKMHVDIGFDLFDTLGFLYEEAGQYRKANESLLRAWNARRKARWQVDDDRLNSIERTMKAGGITARKVAVVVEIHDDSVFRVGDVITEYNDRDVYSVEALRQMMRSVEEGQLAALTILRNGKMRTLEIDSSRLDARLNDFIVPADFLDGRSKLEYFNKMHASWARP